jgi:hypothetical protein
VRRNVHYHIRWGEDLDLHRFDTWLEAETRAKEIATMHEIFTIEPADESCAGCKSLGLPTE